MKHRIPLQDQLLKNIGSHDPKASIYTTPLMYRCRENRRAAISTPDSAAWLGPARPHIHTHLQQRGRHNAKAGHEDGSRVLEKNA